MTATDQQPRRSSAPGVTPELPQVHHDDAAGPAVPTSVRTEREPVQGNPLKRMIARLLSALRGDQYMVDAYPATGSEDGARPDGAHSRAEER